jgi:hypothetical protein
VGPDPTGRLADGVLVDACLRARVLSLRLLTIEAVVVLVPAVVDPASPVDRPSQRALRRPSGPPAARRAAGHGLADARRNLSEGAELLALTRRDGR